MPLVEPGDGPAIPGLRMPDDFYWVLGGPRERAWLAGMRHPCSVAGGKVPWAKLRDAGLSRVVSLHAGMHYDPAPLSMLLDENLEDLGHGGPPARPVEEIAVIRRAVRATVGAMNEHEGVVVHCLGGRGRTGAVIGCVLRELDFPAHEAVDYLGRLHRARGRPGWPESPWQSRLVELWGGDMSVLCQKAAATPVAQPHSRHKWESFGGVLFDAEGRILFRAPDGGKAADWTFAKGRAKKGEDPLQAALREVLEEAGIKAEIVGEIPGTYEAHNSITRYWIMQPVAYASGRPVPGRCKTREIRWVTPKVARELLESSRDEVSRLRDLAVLEAALAARK